MKTFFIVFSLVTLIFMPAHAQEDAWSYTDDNLHSGEEVPLNEKELRDVLKPSLSAEENDPFEDVNRVIFGFNDIVDRFFLDRVAAMYKGVVPGVIREHVGYFLRNLSEPIVFTNNILQGQIGDAEDTLRRFLINTTVGLGGILDVSTDLEIPYKREDFGLTLASWGVEPGPYMVLPILGPSNLRDTLGRIGDYTFDPINWWAYTQEEDVYSLARTGAQLVDAKADNLEIIEDIRNSSLDYYASLRAWYHERRKDLALKERQALDTPRPDDKD